MKKVIFALTVLICIIAFGVLEQIYLHKTFSAMKEKALEIQELIETNPDEAYAKSTDLKNYWSQKKHLTEAVISHNETREMTLKVSELEGYTKANDQYSAQAVVNMLVDMCDNYEHILGFSWDTIF